MATDKPRYTVSVDKELFQKIEDFRFEHRFSTRSEATVELIRLGLEQLKSTENKNITVDALSNFTILESSEKSEREELERKADEFAARLEALERKNETLERESEQTRRENTELRQRLEAMEQEDALLNAWNYSNTG